MYHRAAKGWAKHVDFLLLDGICLELALLIANIIRFGKNGFSFDSQYLEMAFVVFLLDFVTIVSIETLKNVLKRGSQVEVVATIKQTIILFLLFVAYLFIAKIGSQVSRLVVFVTFLIYPVLSFATRFTWKHFLRKRMRKSNGNALLIMASREKVARLIREIRDNSYNFYYIAGVVVPDGYQDGECVENVPIVASYDNICEYATGHWVDEILVSTSVEAQLSEAIMDTLISMGITVHINIENTLEKVGVKQVISNVGGLPVISASMNVMSLRQRMAKRALDIVGGLFGCIITGLLYLFIAPAIKKESPGPAIFSQMRVGQNGKVFRFYKFRSMYLDAEERKKELMDQNRVKDGMMFKMDFDPRIIGNRIDENGNQKTGIGELIRKLSVDEFPQFWNVLKGDMSLVGTRPPTLDEYEKYQAHHKARLATKPGITGLWQVSGRSNIQDFEEVVKLDTQYINNWSVSLDIKILIKTFLVVLKREGSL